MKRTTYIDFTRDVHSLLIGLEPYKTYSQMLISPTKFDILHNLKTLQNLTFFCYQ